MKKINFQIKIGLFIAMNFFVFPFFSYAMSIDIEKTQEEIKVGDVVILDVFINTDDQEINAIEGKLIINGEYEIKNINTAGSVFSLWPNKPSYLQDTIEFVGGTPAGVFGSKLKIFSIALKPLKSGNINFSSENVSVFLNDGAGTQVSLEKMIKSVFAYSSNGISVNELENLILEDKTLPEDFEIVIGRDENLFDGQYFASFNTVDNESGINRYEVTEEGYETVRSGNTYVIRNQNLKKDLIVKAIDNAGNIRMVKVEMDNAISGKEKINWFALSIFVVILLIIFLVFKFFRRKNEKF